MLAYQGGDLLPTLLQGQAIDTSWAGTRDQLSNWVRVTPTLQTAEGDLINTRQDTRADAGRRHPPGRSAWSLACTDSGDARGSRRIDAGAVALSNLVVQ